MINEPKKILLVDDEAKIVEVLTSYLIIIAKYNRNADGMGEKILALYACGMSQRDIAEQIKSLYDVKISPELVSKISEKTMPEVNAWQNRVLDQVYPFIFMDAIHYKVKDNHQYVTKAAISGYPYYRLYSPTL